MVKAVIKKLIYRIITKIHTPLKIVIVQSTMPTTGNVDIYAPSSAGYSFLCWITANTSGWISSLYFSTPQNTATKVWRTASSGSGAFYAYALYVKD